jgi:hypothetical protein
LLADTETGFLIFALTHASATFNEKLLLGQGLSITPLDEGAGNGSIGPRSLYEVVRQIDNQKDFQDYILSYEHNPGAVTSEQIQYQRHPVGQIFSIIIICMLISY